MGHVEQHLLSRHLRVPDHFGQRLDAAAGHAGRVETGDPGVLRLAAPLAAHGLVDQRVEFGAVGDAVGVGGETGVREHVLEADRAQEPPQNRFRRGRDRHAAVERPKQAVG